MAQQAETSAAKYSLQTSPRPNAVNYRLVVCSKSQVYPTHRVDFETPAETRHVQRGTVDGVGSLPQHAEVLHHKRAGVILWYNLTGNKESKQQT